MRVKISFAVLIAAFLLSFPVLAADVIPPDAQVTNADCPVQKIENPAFSATLWPVRQEPGSEWVAFRLSIVNKTDKPLTLSWDDTHYIRQGKEAGGFKFENEQFGAKPEPHQPETIAPGGAMSKVIWPASRFYFGGKDIGWFVVPMTAGEGEQGVLLSLGSEGKDLKQALALNIDSQVRVCGLVPGPRR